MFRQEMQQQSAPKPALERILSRARDEARGDKRSILRALRLALARSAARSLDLPVSVIGARQARCAGSEVAATLEDDRLFLLLAGPGNTVGLASIDRGCLAAIIQQQTMGQVFAEEPARRPFTGTDAAMVAPLIDAVLPRAAELADVPADRQCLSGVGYCGRARDRHEAVMAMDHDRYRLFDLTLEFAGGVCQGKLSLALPDLPAPPPETIGPDAPPRQGLDRAFGVVRADLTAVIARVRLPLSGFAAMKPGDLVPLVENRLDRTEVVSVAGNQVATARLGQSRGMRALRFNETVPDASELSEFEAGLTEAPVLDPAAALSDPRVIDHAAIEPVSGAGAQVPAETEVEEEVRLSPEQISELAGLSGSGSGPDPET